MSVDEPEEEEGGKKPRGRPNHWFAEQGGGYGGNYRGVPTPRAGPQAVTKDDIIGDIDTCWCGEPQDHTWPGKASGRKHPRKVEAVTMAAREVERPRLERNQVTGFHKDVQDIMLTAVNEFGCRFRMNVGRAGGVMLYAPDGSAPIKVMPRKSDMAFLPQLRRWFIQHIAKDEQAVRKARTALAEEPEKKAAPLEVVTEAAVRDLAAELNGPEHQAQEKKSAPEKPAESLAPSPAAPAQPATRDAEMREAAINQKEQPDLQVPEADWVPHLVAGGAESPYFETLMVGDVKWYRCKLCIDTDHNLLTTVARGLGGHARTRHTDTTSLYDRDSAEKKYDTRKFNRLKEEVTAGLDLIAKAVGLDSQADRVVELEKKNTALQARVEKAEAERDNLQAKLDLMKEAFSA